MSSPISDKARDILARSLPLLKPHKDRITERIELHLRSAGGEKEPFGQSQAAAMLLVQLLLDQARMLVETGESAACNGIREEHRALEIDGRHYSRFGDALVPVLRDVLGANVPREVAGIWCDTFWAAVRHSESQTEVAP
jgi:hemoglobin-like flavoprotein